MNIEDEHAITRVLLNYATGIDQRDWALFASVFTSDVIADYGTFGTWHGPEAIVEHMIKAHLPYGKTVHRITNIVIEVTGNEAVATSYGDALLLPLQPGGRSRHPTAVYHDRLVRGPEGWQICHRRLEMVRMAVLDEGE